MDEIIKSNQNTKINFSKDGNISLRVCSFNKIDTYNDEVSPNAFDEQLEAINKSNSKPIVVIDWDHQDKITICKSIDKLYKQEDGLYADFKVDEEWKNNNPQFFNKLINLFENKKLFASMSASNEDSILKGNRFESKKSLQYDLLKKLKLKKIALTEDPIDRTAEVLIFKSFLKIPKYPIHLSETWSDSEANKNWKEYSDSVDKPSALYKNAFLYVESGKEDLFDSYHFQIVDIIDGEPMINSRAIIAIRGYLAGARFGIKILNETEKNKLATTLAVLYKKINIVRKQEGLELLNYDDIIVKSQTLNQRIETEIDGKMSAINLLKENIENFSNTNINNFVEKLANIFNNKNNKVFETQSQESIVNKSSNVEKKINLISQVAEIINKNKK
jgi:hypothetical protein